MKRSQLDALWHEAEEQSRKEGAMYTRYHFAALVAAAERNILAAWMTQFGFATGHGDTMEQLVDALGSEIVDRIEIEIDVAVAAEREACAKVCEQSDKDGEGPDCWDWHAKDYAAAIRARKENT